MQLNLASNIGEEKKSFFDILSKQIGNLASLKFTKNRTRILSANKVRGSYNIRIHHGFELAPLNVIEDIANCILNRNKYSSHSIHEYFQNFIKKEYDTNNIKKRKIKAEGKYFNLNQLLDRINNKYFNGSINVGITWGYKPKKRKQFVKSRHITLGQYSKPENLIIIHPNLDKKQIPEYFVESVIYHEICHYLVGEKRSQYKRMIHTREFKELEKRFIYYNDANKWEKDNFNYIIRNI